MFFSLSERAVLHRTTPFDISWEVESSTKTAFVQEVSFYQTIYLIHILYIYIIYICFGVFSTYPPQNKKKNITSKEMIVLTFLLVAMTL